VGTDPPLGTYCLPSRPGRTYEDASGTIWRVTEHESDGQQTLVFMSSSAMRRVRHYPNDWRRLPLEALEALSWER
jgi:hypothetical protein